MNKPQAVIFDMDGLLVNSEPAWGRAERGLIESRGHEFNVEIRKQIIGMRIDKIVQTFAEFYGLPDDIDALAGELVQRMLDTIPDGVPAMPGAGSLLEFLQEQDVPCAIASSSSLPIINAITANLGWKDRFGVRCSADAVAHGKPAPDVYLLAAQKLGVEPSRCLALEDSVTGARAAVAAGMVCFAVPEMELVDPARFEGVTPHVYESLHHVLDALRAL
jgi:sugar-phosphatase